MTVQMMRKRPYPRALRLVAWIDRLEEPVGLARINPCEDALEVLADHGGHLLYRLDLRAHDVGAPLAQQVVHDVRLLAGEDVAQLFAVLPRAGRAAVGDANEPLIEFGALGARACPAASASPSGRDRASARGAG